jgi:hypothetical protein
MPERLFARALMRRRLGARILLIIVAVCHMQLIHRAGSEKSKDAVTNGGTNVRVSLMSDRRLAHRPRS